MKKITDIPEHKENCTGCMACVDVCPQSCIAITAGADGFFYPELDESKCIDCGKCRSICPIENKRTADTEQTLYAAYAKAPDVKNRGSSGGMFELLAKHCLAQGYYVCGAAFEGTTLKHRLIHREEDLPPLLKSKYLQSDTRGIYGQLLALLKNGQKVLFCGTPCQVSALVNVVPAQQRENLLTVDIICHGVPAQKTFDGYIQTLEQKHKEKIRAFSFRVKDNRYRHANGFRYITESGKQVNGIYTNSTFYNGFKRYLFFRESCYRCRYATVARVADITLGDFWGIEKHDPSANTDAGVSMIILNTPKGHQQFAAVKEDLVYKQYPLQYGVDANHCLSKSAVKPAKRDTIVAELAQAGYEATAKKYFQPSLVQKVYWLIPPALRNSIRKLRGG